MNLHNKFPSTIECTRLTTLSAKTELIFLGAAYKSYQLVSHICMYIHMYAYVSMYVSLYTKYI